MGVYPGSSITGTGSVTGSFAVITEAAALLQAQTDLTAAYNAAAALGATHDLSGQNLGGMTLVPGVYSFSSEALLTAGTKTLTLNAEGNANAQFVFQITSTLTTASNSSVVTINGGLTPDCSVFWQVGSSATLGTGTAFEGHILALTSIALQTGATILDGSALARNGAVTLDTNTITNCVPGSALATPEPGAMTLALIGAPLMGLFALVGKRLRERRARN